MAIVIILIIAFWNLPFSNPTLPILMTIFGSLYCLFRIIRVIARAVNESNKPQKTGYDLLDRFIK